MTDVGTQAASIYRDFENDGNALSGPHKPVKADIRALWAAAKLQLDSVATIPGLQSAITALQASQGAGAIAFDTLAHLNANLAYAANTPATVYNDPTPSNNGVYVKVGASGTGSWTSISSLTLPGVSNSLNTFEQTTARQIGNVAAIIGGERPDISVRVTVGYASLSGTLLAAPTGNLWIMTDQPLRSGPLYSLSAIINSVGSGVGAFVFYNPRKQRIEQSFPVTITATGLTTFVAGIDTPPLGVRSEWLLGWWSPSGGASISYVNSTGFTPTSLFLAMSSVPNVQIAPATSEAVLGLSARISALSLVVTNPIQALTSGALPSGVIWADPKGLRLPGGLLTELHAYISGAALGTGSFVVLSPKGGYSYKIDHIINVTGLVNGVNMLTAETNFTAVSVQAGSVLAWWAPTSGAQPAFDNYQGTDSLFFTSASPSEGTTFTALVNSIRPAIGAAVSPNIYEDVATKIADLDTLLTERERVITASASIYANSVTVNGILDHDGIEVGFSGQLNLDAATTGIVTEARTISGGSVVYGASALGNRLSNANVSSVVVTDAGTSATLIEGTDYVVGYEHGVVTYLGSGSRNVNIAYHYSKRRYDSIFVDAETMALSVVKGTERVRDAAEFVPAQPSSNKIRLFNVRVTNSSVVAIPTWDVEQGIRRETAALFTADKERAKSALVSLRSKISQGASVSLGMQGDSIVAEQSDFVSTTAPNGQNRDRAAASGTPQVYLEALSSDIVSTLPLFDQGDGAGAVHTHASLAWYAMAELGRTGTAFTYLNFGVATWSSNEGNTDPYKSAVAISAADCVILHYGMNDLGLSTTEANMRSIIDNLYAHGKEVIVVAPPRTNSEFGAPDTDWFYTCRALRRAAQYTDPVSGRSAAYLDTTLLYTDENLGALGISREDFCQANLDNHPGIREHQLIGRLLARLVLG